MLDIQQVERRLTDPEYAMLQRVFNGALDLSVLRILNYDPTGQKRTRTYHAGGRIHLLGGDYADDVTQGTLKQKSTLVHEAAHAWQFQKTGYESSDESLHAKLQQIEYDTWLEIASLMDSIDFRVSAWPAADRERVRAEWLRHSAKTLDSLEQVCHSVNMQLDRNKTAFGARDVYDPKFVAGPLRENEQPLSFVGEPTNEPWTQTTAQSRPVLGERLSDYLWRDPFYRTMFARKERLLFALKRWAKSSNNLDYNYRLAPLDSVDFFDLNTEAQAQMITDYFMLKSGADPRSVWYYIDTKPRPPLSVYEHMIPFLASPVCD